MSTAKEDLVKTEQRKARNWLLQKLHIGMTLEINDGAELAWMSRGQERWQVAYGTAVAVREIAKLRKSRRKVGVGVLAYKLKYSTK